MCFSINFICKSWVRSATLQTDITFCLGSVGFFDRTNYEFPKLFYLLFSGFVVFHTP